MEDKTDFTKFSNYHGNKIVYFRVAHGKILKTGDMGYHGGGESVIFKVPMSAFSRKDGGETMGFLDLNITITTLYTSKEYTAKDVITTSNPKINKMFVSFCDSVCVELDLSSIQKREFMNGEKKFNKLMEGIDAIVEAKKEDKKISFLEKFQSFFDKGSYMYDFLGLFR